MHGGMGHWNIYYTSPQSFLFVDLTTHFYSISIGLVHLVKCPNVSTSNCNLQKGYFCVSSLRGYVNLSTNVLSPRSLFQMANYRFPFLPKCRIYIFNARIWNYLSALIGATEIMQYL